MRLTGTMNSVVVEEEEEDKVVVGLASKEEVGEKLELVEPSLIIIVLTIPLGPVVSSNSLSGSLDVDKSPVKVLTYVLTIPLGLVMSSNLISGSIDVNKSFVKVVVYKHKHTEAVDTTLKYF